MNMVGHPANFYEYGPHPFDDTPDILVEASEIVVQNVGSLGLGMENDM